MTFCITVNDEPVKNSEGKYYEFKTPMEAIKMVDILYGLSSLKEDVAIGMLNGTDISFDVGDMDEFMESIK